MEEIYEKGNTFRPKKYICQTPDAKLNLEDSKNMQSKRISFRDVVLLAQKYDKNILEHKHIEKITHSLKKMCKYKLFKEQRQHPFWHAISMIVDCIKNLWDGYGFKTSPSIALELIDKWSTKIVKEPPHIQHSSPIQDMVKETPLRQDTRQDNALADKMDASTPSSKPISSIIPVMSEHKEQNGKLYRSSKSHNAQTKTSGLSGGGSANTAENTQPNARDKNPNTQIPRGEFHRDVVVRRLTNQWEERKKIVDFVPSRNSDIPQVTRETSLKKAIETFKRNPLHCHEMDSNIIFFDLASIEDVVLLMNKVGPSRDIMKPVEDVVSALKDHTTLKQNLYALNNSWEQAKRQNAQLFTMFAEVEQILLKMHNEKDMIKQEILCCVLKLFDMNDEVNKQIILNVLKRCKKEVAKDLATVLSKNAAFDLSFLTQCFDVYIEKHKQTGVNDFTLFIVETLVKIYDTHYLNNPHSQENPPLIPVNHPSVIGVFAILLESKHNNDDKVREYLGRLMQKKEFDALTQKKLLSVFDKKQENCVYLAKEMLLNHFYTRH